MWTARAFMNSGETEQLRLAVIEGRRASMRELARLARGVVAETDVAVPWHLLDAQLEFGALP
jgi:hypothetical protein